MSLNAVILTLAPLGVTAGPTRAQSGRADLRYVAPLPATVVFTTTDSISNTMNLPTGDMAMTGFLSSTSELSFSEAKGVVTVSATLKEFKGQMTSPMGELPMGGGAQPPIEITLDATGPSADKMSDILNPRSAITSPGSAAGLGRVLEPLLRVPGRQLRIGETWVDTVRMSPKMEGLEMNMETVTRGTYVADTTVAGKVLNVLSLTADMTSKTGGVIQGNSMTQNMKSHSEERVLWSSALHSLVKRDQVTEMTMEAIVGTEQMTMNSKGRTRSITVAQP